MRNAPIYGVLAEFDGPIELTEAAEKAYAAGFRHMDAYSPFPIEEVSEALGISRASVKTRLLRARLMLRDLLAPRIASGFFSRVPFEKGNKPW